jgi:hypothetical protein
MTELSLLRRAIRPLLVGGLGVLVALGPMACSPQSQTANTPQEAVVGADLTQVALVGDWSGLLELPGGQSLPLVIHVTSGAAGALGVSFDSPDQGASGIAADRVSFADGVLSAQFSVIGATLSAQAGDTPDTLKAAWTQGVVLPLALSRGVNLPQRKRPQEPVQRPYVIQAVSFESLASGVRLAGELTLPPGDGPFPGVVLISGSGPQDRDETLMGHRPFLVLSDHLTRAGFAVLRYDDRGVGESTGDFSTATTSDFADDAAAAMGFLRADGRVETTRLTYIGHSEGGLVAPMAAQREEATALALLAAPAQTLAEIAVQQTRDMMRAEGAATEQVDAAVDALEQALALLRASDDLESVREQTVALYLKAGLPEEMARARAEFTASVWMQWVMDYDPRPALRAFDGPVLAVFGGKDTQVSAALNAPLMEAELLHPASRVVVLDGLNHLFQPATTGGMSEYARIETTLDPSVLEAVTAFLQEPLPRRYPHREP